jgi:hypothetical protein
MASDVKIGGSPTHTTTQNREHHAMEPVSPLIFVVLFRARRLPSTRHRKHCCHVRGTAAQWLN